MYQAQLIGSDMIIEQHLTTTKCWDILDPVLKIGTCTPHESPMDIIIWEDPHHPPDDMHNLKVHEIQQQGQYVLIPTLHVGGAVQEHYGLDKEILQLDNGLVIRNIKLAPELLHGLLDIVATYAKQVADDVVAPMLEAHIVRTLFLQKQLMAKEWERLCFMQREVTQLQKWTITVFPSTAANFIHQHPGTRVEPLGDALEVKKCRPIFDYKIVTNRKIGSRCFRHFPISLPYSNATYFLRITDRHLLSKSPVIKCKNRPPVTYLKAENGSYFLIEANGIIIPKSVMNDTANEMKSFKSTQK